MNTISDILSIGTLISIIGIIFKGYNFIQNQAREDESIRHRLSTLETTKSDLKNDLKELKIKNELDYRAISDKMDKNSEAINNKIDELKDLLFDLIRDKK
tara:strand:- start:120 stop:419 length:300 start_codon:yes stop_codon:yes gene_type:complete